MSAPLSQLLDLLAIGTRGLRGRTLRTALAAAGIAIGIAMVVLVTSVPASSQADLERKMTALGADLLRITPVQSGDQQRTLPEESLSMMDRVGPVHKTAVVAALSEPVRKNGFEPSSDGALTAYAVDGDLIGVLRANLADGVFLRQGGADTQAVLGSAAAERLGLRGLPDEPTTVQVGDVSFTIVGILEPMRLAPDLDAAVMMSWHGAMGQFGFTGGPTAAYLTADEALIEAVRPILAATLSPAGPGYVQVSLPSAVLAAKETSRESFDGMFLAMAAISLTVGGIGIANTMFASVLERRREVGLRRALGAPRTAIAAQFLIEAVVLCLLGGLLGAGTGAAVSALWAGNQGWPAVVPVQAIVGAVVAALVTGILAGLAPSIRAAALPPTAALAAE